MAAEALTCRVFRSLETLNAAYLLPPIAVIPQGQYFVTVQMEEVAARGALTTTDQGPRLPLRATRMPSLRGNVKLDFNGRRNPEVDFLELTRLTRLSAIRAQYWIPKVDTMPNSRLSQREN